MISTDVPPSARAEPSPVQVVDLPTPPLDDAKTRIMNEASRPKRQNGQLDKRANGHLHPWRPEYICDHQYTE